MKPRNLVVRICLASGTALGLGAAGLVGAGTHGRHIDVYKPWEASVAETAPSGDIYLSRQPYSGRRIDNPQVIVGTRRMEQAELAAFEAGHPAPARTEQHLGRGPR